mgnify:CR=1|jgi:hypothetical protein
MDDAELKKWAAAPVSQSEIDELAQIKAINKAMALAAPGQTIKASALANGITLTQGDMSDEAYAETLNMVPRPTGQ